MFLLKMKIWMYHISNQNANEIVCMFVENIFIILLNKCICIRKAKNI